MSRVGSLEFQRKFGEYQHQAQREPVEITRHGRRALVLMSADHYDWLSAAAQRTHRTEEAADVVIDPRNADAVDFGVNPVAGRLLREEAVAVLPGSALGEGGEGHFRIALTVPEARLEEATRRIGRLLARAGATE